ncbi:SDR family oxidoreductase [Subsaximicrobium wynnwilliamsii]|uniref:SDR family oxidoreductase n=1 Tax=Subsaximicrobium wynnwilliamsii TaxID=291179 RepID=A0A5C6ZNX8_9FLAO|nr:SDR family oxidoreductase [Subsaximicrobium wynnwilliamsii]TXD85242.1 SDR family oxidoreductase [Subsaximicrobium wynnwilliamsii]TXD91285.1 SDR family oxidoreductase [Subsaximicrobium wynnwilliamsii]TXE04678.1 SDR family oxidoreductase [Subsaximicrobium wynnwilliamsii]
MENVLIAGAHGTTGKQIVNLLKQSQYFKPVAMVRTEDQVKQFENEGVATVLADLEKDLAHAVIDIDKVVFAAGSGGKKVIEVDQEGAKRLVDASKQANVKKFVMLSSMGADAPEKAEELQDYLKAKHNADEYLKQSGLNYAIVRPGSLTNNKATDHIQLKEKLNKRGEISRADVAQTLVRSLNDDTANKATFEILEGDTLIGKAMDTLSEVKS